MKPQLILLKSILIACLLTSCSPSGRLERLVEHHPELKTTDTVRFFDIVPVPPVSIDTTLPVISLADTAIISRDRLEISLLRIRDTVIVHGKCKADTIIHEILIPVEHIKLVSQAPKYCSFLKFIWIIAMVFITLILLRKVMK